MNNAHSGHSGHNTSTTLSTGKHVGHMTDDVSKMGFWEKFKMSMSMTMGMDHTGLAGREMARLSEQSKNQPQELRWACIHSRSQSLYGC